MIKKYFRLSPSSLYQQVFKEGKFLDHPLFTVIFKKNDLGHPRFGIIVSLKVSSLAPKRNFIKRRIRAILHQIIPQYQKSFDIIILAKKEILTCSFQEMQEQLINLLNKIF